MTGLAAFKVRDTLGTQGDIEAIIKQASPFVDTVRKEGDTFRVDYYSGMERYPDGRSDINDLMVKGQLEQAGFEVLGNAY